MTLDAQRIYTADDLWELAHAPAYADLRLELANGELIARPPASSEHGVYAMDIGAFIWTHVRTHRLGRVFAAETGFILNAADAERESDIVRAPDVAFVAAAPIPADGLPQAGYAPLTPDLAVEVVSPNDRGGEIEAKVDEYLRYGTQMVLVVYTKARIVYVHRPTLTRRLTIDDTLDGEDVLPGFTLPLRDLFTLP